MVNYYNCLLRIIKSDYGEDDPILQTVNYEAGREVDPGAHSSASKTGGGFSD